MVERAVVGLFSPGSSFRTAAPAACATPLKSIPRRCAVRARRGRCRSPASSPAAGAPPIWRGEAALGPWHTPRGRDRRGQCARRLLLAPPSPSRCRAVPGHRRARCDRNPQRRPGSIVVGAFVPFPQGAETARPAQSGAGAGPATLKADELPFFCRAEQAPDILPQADVALITGSTLVNGDARKSAGAGQTRGTGHRRRPNCRPPARRVSRARRRRFGLRRDHRRDAFLDLLAEGGSGYQFLRPVGAKAEPAARDARPPRAGPQPLVVRDLKRGTGDPSPASLRTAPSPAMREKDPSPPGLGGRRLGEEPSVLILTTRTASVANDTWVTLNAWPVRFLPAAWAGSGPGSAGRRRTRRRYRRRRRSARRSRPRGSGHHRMAERGQRGRRRRAGRARLRGHHRLAEAAVDAVDQRPGATMGHAHLPPERRRSSPGCRSAPTA